MTELSSSSVSLGGREKKMLWTETVKEESNAQAGKVTWVVSLLTLISYVAIVIIYPPRLPLPSIRDQLVWVIVLGIFTLFIVAMMVFEGVSWVLFRYRIQNGIRSGKSIGTYSLASENIDSVRAYGLVNIIGPNPLNKTVDRIYLASCRMSEKTACEIADGLRNNTTIKSFALSRIYPYNSVNCERAQSIANSQKIDMSKVAIQIADALLENVTLAELDLAENCQSTATLKNRMTYVIRTPVGDPGVIALSNTLETNTALIRLTLSYCGITGSGAIAIARMLAKNKTLRQLDIDHNDIGDDALVAFGEALSENASLRVFDLTESEIGDRGALALAAALMTNKTLYKLVLDKNRIMCGGIISLARMLMTNSTLRVLWLNHTEIGDCGAIELSEALKINTTLEELCVAYSGIETHGMRAISDALVVNKTLQDFDIRQDNRKCDETPILKSVALNKGLRTLSVDFSRRRNEKILISALHLNDWITTINCDYVRRGSYGCSSCDGIEQIEFLMIQKCLEENSRCRSKSSLFRNVKVLPDCFVFCCEW